MTLSLALLSFFLIPRRTIASPCFDTVSLMNLSAFEILSMSVHHLNNEVGAGYPKPSSRTQKVSEVGGLSRFVSRGRPIFLAAFLGSIMASRLAGSDVWEGFGPVKNLTSLFLLFPFAVIVGTDIRAGPVLDMRLEVVDPVAEYRNGRLADVLITNLMVGQAEIMQVVFTLRVARRLARSLHGGQ